MKKNISSIAKIPDITLSNLYLRLFSEKNSLIIFLFHSVFLDKKERDKNLIDPKIGILINEFEKFIEYFYKNDYIFISYDKIINGLDENKKYIMLTFDDGYYNNINVLPILEKYNIPSLFFVSTFNILNNQGFWWDVLYRERIKQEIPKKNLHFEQNYLKTCKHWEIIEYIKSRFGEDSYKPLNGIDRPFSIDELKNFSKEKYVSIGNHTSNHAILTNYETPEILSQISDAQKIIKMITGKNPICFSYPNGNYSNNIVKITKDLGFKLGFTTDFKKNYLPLETKNDDYMKLGRFSLFDNFEIENQCQLFRSDIVLYNRIWNFIKHNTKN